MTQTAPATAAAFAASGLDGTRSDRIVLYFGVALGVLLALVLGAAIARDRVARLDAAAQQAAALANGAQRLMWLELRNLERAMQGIASDAERYADRSDEETATPVAAMIAGVLARQQELAGLVLLDRDGRALTPGAQSPGSGRLLPATGPRPHAMALGLPQAGASGWMVPLQVPLHGGRRLLAWLHADELQRRARDLDAGRDGLVQLLTHDGVVLADSRGAAHIGAPQAAADDAVARVLAGRDLPGYPLRVRVGLARAQVLAPWYWVLLVGTLMFALYWVGLGALYRTVRRNARARAQLVRQLEATAGGLRLAQQLGRTGSWEVTRGGPITWSEPVAAILGLDERRTVAEVEEFYARVHPADREELAGVLRRAWDTHEPFALDFRVVAPGNVVRWVSGRGQSIPGEDGQQRMAGTVLDITDRVQAERRLADAERLFRMLFDCNPLPFWVFDVGTLRFLEVNQAALAQYGYSREEFLAMTILDIRPLEQRAPAESDTARRGPRDFEPEQQVWLHRRRDGQTLEVRIYTADIDFRGRPARLVLAQDVSDRLAHERELAWRASHDMTTGLANARALADGIQAHRDPGCRIAYAQLRGLELIEDSLGLRAGQDTLRAIARRLERLGQRYGLAGHVRGEEFALVVTDLSRWPRALEELRAELARPVTGEDYLQRLEAWIGTADFPADAADPGQALGNAGLAAHQARGEGVPLLRFEPAMAQRASDRLHLAGRIHHALDAGQFELHFQTIRRAGDAQPYALEALVRWPQADGGFIPPGQFIPIAEDSGLIVPLGQWVLAQAARAQHALVEAGFGGVPIAVNVSLAQFLHGDLVEDVERAIAQCGLQRGALHLELTESILMTRPEAALAMLRRLRKNGACVSLDDFGTGYSSMSYLRHLPLDTLKIDRSFVRHVHQDERNASICLALLALARSLGLTVVAEGVEEVAEWEWLRSHDCDFVQGYAFDRPAPMAQVLERLRTLQRNRGASAMARAADARAASGRRARGG